MNPEFENNCHLDPEMTWQDTATFLYDGIMDGKLSKENFINFFILSGQEMSEPRHTRIFAKTLAAFFERDYQDLKDDEKPGVFVIVNGKQYIVSHNDTEITIQEANDIKNVNVKDCSFLISHETEADAQIAAWRNKEKYIEPISKE